jgi:sulfate transporter 4
MSVIRSENISKVAADDLALQNAGEVQYIILDLSPVSHIDTTGLHVLEDMYLTQEKLGVQICLCLPGNSVMERLLKSGMVDLVGRNHFFSDVIIAVQWCLNEMDCAGSQSVEGLSVSYPPAKGEDEV